MVSDAKSIAQYIVNYFINANAPVSNLQLQKLLYFSWIDYYQKKKGAYLFDESFVAWPLGPVVLSAYYDFCAYGAEPIFRCRPVSLSGLDTKTLDTCLARFKGWAAYDLVSKSHRKGGAWDSVYQGGKGRDRVIDFELIVDKECERVSC